MDILINYVTPMAVNNFCRKLHVIGDQTHVSHTDFYLRLSVNIENVKFDGINIGDRVCSVEIRDKRGFREVF